MTAAAIGLVALTGCSAGDGTSDGGVAGDGSLPVWSFDVIGVDAPRPIDRVDLDGLIPRCTTLNVSACACTSGARGVQVCQDDGRWGSCDCRTRPVATGLPPRLLWPTTSHQVTSQRPTLRWVLPDGVTRARVELCDDRACARRLAMVEVAGTSWRSPTALRPGVVFWRVVGVSNAGADVWTSATWSFGVRRRDTPVDSILGRYKDFNGDGYDDLLIVSAQPRGRVALQLRLGGSSGLAEDASFIWMPLSEADYTGLSLVTGDVNGDGLADVLMAYGHGAPVDRKPALFYGQRDGTLRGPDPSVAKNKNFDGPAGAIELLDFNGDGFDDPVVIGVGLNALSIELHPGGTDGASATPVVSDWGRPRDPVAGNAAGGDYNGDGYSDLTVWVPDYLAAFPGNPSGEIPTVPESRDGFVNFLTREGERGLWAADLDGDQDTDVISGTQVAPFYAAGGTLHHLYRYDSRYEEDLSPGVTQPWQWVALGAAGRPGDVNGDGYPDAPATEYCWARPPAALLPDVVDLGCVQGREVIYPGGPAGLSKAPLLSRDVPTRAWISVGGDFDGDGWDEVVEAQGGRYTIGRWRDGQVAWDAPRTVPSTTRIVRMH